MKDDVDKVVISHLSIFIESIEIVKVFLYRPCLLSYYNIIVCFVCLVVVPIIILEGFLDF